VTLSTWVDKTGIIVDNPPNIVDKTQNIVDKPPNIVDKKIPPLKIQIKVPSIAGRNLLKTEIKGNFTLGGINLIAKERQIPLIIFEIDAILSRIHVNHPKRVTLEENRRNYMTGYHGEKQIDYHLESYIKGNTCLYFAGLRLLFENQAFQMDTLFVTASFILIIESKNIVGSLTFEKDSTQVIREYNDKVQGFKNPIVQVERQKRLLTAWLQKRKFPLIPIIDLVGIADRRTLIKTTSDNRKIFEKIFYADILMNKINNLEALFVDKKLTPKQIQKLKETLNKEHTPAPPSILKTHGIKDSEIIKGIQCPHCKQYSLCRIVKKWYCRNCHLYSNNSHRQGIRDFFLIMSESISNKQCREFLLIDCPNAAKRVLASMNLPTTGSKKYRMYHRPHEF
jgi:hypothetical protein